MLSCKEEGVYGSGVVVSKKKKETELPSQQQLERAANLLAVQGENNRTGKKTEGVREGRRGKLETRIEKSDRVAGERDLEMRKTSRKKKGGGRRSIWRIRFPGLL